MANIKFDKITHHILFVYILFYNKKQIDKPKLSSDITVCNMISSRVVFSFK